MTFPYLKGPRSDKVYFLKTIEFLKENIGFRGSKATEREPNGRFLEFLFLCRFGDGFWTTFWLDLGGVWEALWRLFDGQIRGENLEGKKEAVVARECAARRRGGWLLGGIMGGLRMIRISPERRWLPKGGGGFKRSAHSAGPICIR